MKNHRLLILVFILLVMSACMGRKPVATRYYLIEYPFVHDNINAPNEEEKVFPGPLLIMPVSVHPAYSSHQIAIRENTHQINYFAQSEWAVRPAQSFDMLLSRFFSQHVWFTEIKEHKSQVLEGFTLASNVLNMEVVSSRQVFAASLTFEFNLNDNRTGLTHTSGVLNRQKVLRSKNLNLFAGAVSELFLDELHIFLDQIYSNTTND